MSTGFPYYLNLKVQRTLAFYGSLQPLLESQKTWVTGLWLKSSKAYIIHCLCPLLLAQTLAYRWSL